jgi:hypothetical protein
LDTKEEMGQMEKIPPKYGGDGSSASGSFKKHFFYSRERSEVTNLAFFEEVLIF